ncbi:hypothetical protein WM40_15470 [Robbsia andropogonis]|uniref:HTH araC/xylS-type domain-containing protein n=1 Tax=Robbsia andropogonis TaxID=28092 RepID=A0A0F5JZH2_9BURK|nr:helix-turn-helix transcriptional regulator [Robbsia andropogonis]KKB62707.1 hypothetical protein WM40_15470 [Robbsia andropogonis]MCP1119741.1 helix-turn-helix transcriptional regulator [Robbsia andropogonis]MCP1129724.1 helix-turn-helix transcriptional regulator [Robbsia andropogonis]
MSTSLYFAVASTLSTSHPSATYCAKMLAGQYSEAATIAAARADYDRAGFQPTYADMQAYADVQLVLGRYEDAEETYRRAQKSMLGDRGTMRAALSRNAGWQALFQNHMGTALMCFRRVMEDELATPIQKCECTVGTILVLFNLGRLDTVRLRLETLGELARDADDPRWRRLADTLRHELLAQYRLRASEPLSDHIYWRSVILEFVPNALVDGLAILSDDNTPAIEVLSKRADFLNNLLVLSRGSHAGLAQIDTYLRWSQSAGLHGYHRGLRLEVALAALASKSADVAENMLRMFRDVSMHANQNARWYLEYLYCHSKVHQQHGRMLEHAQTYGRYALLSIKHVRADSEAMPTAPEERVIPAPDDLSARLPGKYRRAYRYLVDHLECADLSVREVANHIGVSERALQAAFKTHLGLSPSELIRGKRMEHIRGELMANDDQAASVLQIASRWGVQHRSTLLNGYRKMYREAPSETLSR